MAEEDVFKRALLVGEVAQLAKDIEERRLRLEETGLDKESFSKFVDAKEEDSEEEDSEEDDSADADDSNSNSNSANSGSSDDMSIKLSNSIGERNRRAVANVVTDSTRDVQIGELLGAWEEPKIEGAATVSQWNAVINCNCFDCD